MSNPPLGLIAGQGVLPLLEARGMRAAGREVACVGLAHQYDPALPRECDLFASAGMIALGRWIRLLRRWQVREAVMIGGVRKAGMYEPFKMLRQLPDWRAANLWYRKLRHDRRDQAVLAAVADELQKNGITLIDSTQYIREHLATPGILTPNQPTAGQQADIEFGWPLLMQIADLDIGQAMAVKDRDIIAVEAIEGTDAMIQRAGSLCRSGGWVLLKGACRAKDMRFDVPTVGVQTIQRMKQCGAACLAVAAEKVIFADKPSVIAAARQAGIAIVCLPVPP